MKRMFDLCVSLVAFIIFFIPMVIVGLVVSVKMGSPIMFNQRRPGFKGRPFNIYKFRTMTNETDEQGDLLPDEVRLNKTGQVIRKLSLDELPQLFNVLKGELSLVGPRPLAMQYLPLYNKEQARRHDVRPGITGWAQINGRTEISWEDRFKLDVWYVDNRTFLLDIIILFKTVLKVLQSEGVTPTNTKYDENFEGTPDKKQIK